MMTAHYYNKYIRPVLKEWEDCENDIKEELAPTDDIFKEIKDEDRDRKMLAAIEAIRGLEQLEMEIFILNKIQGLTRSQIAKIEDMEQIEVSRTYKIIREKLNL